MSPGRFILESLIGATLIFGAPWLIVIAWALFQ